MVNMAMLGIEHNRICQPFYFYAAVRICFVWIVVEYDIEFVPATVECAPHNLTGLYLTVNHNHILAKVNHKYKDKEFLYHIHCFMLLQFQHSSAINFYLCSRNFS